MKLKFIDLILVVSFLLGVGAIYLVVSDFEVSQEEPTSESIAPIKTGSF